VQDLRKIAASDPTYPPILFVYQGTVADGATFFGGLWPEARAVSDLPKRLYTTFGLARGGMTEMFGPDVWISGARAAMKGHFIGAPVGDPWMMPGAFLVQGERVLWRHVSRHAGDHPEWAGVPRNHERVSE
jgi:hypothetical protein